MDDQKNNGDDESKVKPHVVHQCEHCRATMTPAESGQGVNVSGIVKCKICGHVGPLRVKVVNKEKINLIILQD